MWPCLVRLLREGKMAWPAGGWTGATQTQGEAHVQGMRGGGAYQLWGSSVAHVEIQQGKHTVKAGSRLGAASEVSVCSHALRVYVHQSVEIPIRTTTAAVETAASLPHAVAPPRSLRLVVARCFSSWDQVA